MVGFVIYCLLMNFLNFIKKWKWYSCNKPDPIFLLEGSLDYLSCARPVNNNLSPVPIFKFHSFHFLFFRHDRKKCCRVRNDSNHCFENPIWVRQIQLHQNVHCSLGDLQSWRCTWPLLWPSKLTFCLLLFSLKNVCLVVLQAFVFLI